MLEFARDAVEGLIGFAANPAGAIAGWTFDKVTTGIYEWLARGLALQIASVWGLLDTGTTPRLTEDWFANDLVGRVAAIGLTVVVAMLLVSAAQAALAGRPDLIGDAVGQSVRAILASALTVTVVDQCIGVVDAVSANVWGLARGDLAAVMENLLRVAMAITSIDAGQLAGDLAERMLLIELDRIPPGRRRTDAEVAGAYQHARPAAFGALLDLTAQVLRTLPTIQLAEAPRMADFARILAALDHTCGWHTLTDYTAAAAEANRNVLEADPIAEAVCALVGPGGGWQGTATELLERITPERPPRKWPRSPQAISGALKRLAPALRGQGIHVEFDREGRDRRRAITLRADPQ